MRRATGWAAAALALAAGLGADAPPGGRGLDIFFIDVNGGAATLLVTPEGESVLIDSGWPGEDDRDPKRIEKVLRDEAKLDHLDHLITTHWHVDHFGGVAGLAKRVRIDHYWDRGLPDPDAPDGDRARFPDGPGPDDPLGRAYRAASAGKRVTLKASQEFRLKGETRAVVLASGGEGPEHSAAPRGQHCEGMPPDQPEDRSDNARSLALRFRLGRFDFLDCGDLTWNVEKSLVCPSDLIGPIDLFQVTHHGMDISNHPSLLATIAPTVSVMNNGPRKGGSSATVRRLRALPSIEANYQLHKNAATGPDDNADPALIANADPAGGRFIRATVRPDGSSYTVRIGPDGPAREFRSR